MRRLAFASIGCVLVLAASLPVAEGAPGPGRQRWRDCGVWTKVSVPEPNDGSLRDVVVVSPTEAWAVGALGAEEYLEPVALHWTGQRWESVRFPRLPGDPMTVTLNAVDVTADGTVWAVGGRSTGRGSLRPLTARYAGGRWHVVPIAAREIRGSLQGLAAIPGTHALWAVGHMFEPRSAALTLRWNGTKWRRFRVPVSAPGNVDALAAVVAFPRTAWAVGSTTADGSSSFMVAARWHADGWRSMIGPRGVALGVDGLGPDDLVAAGWRPTAGIFDRPTVFGWKGEGWRRVYSDDHVGFLRDVVYPAPGVAWAVGSRSRRDGPLVLRMEGGTWHRSSAPDVAGFFEAIDGTPNNLWIMHTRTYRNHEGSLFNTYHRC
jgi:hypothetical protein